MRADIVSVGTAALNLNRTCSASGQAIFKNGDVVDGRGRSADLFLASYVF